MLEHIKKSVNDAQLVLVGIGEEFDIKRYLVKNETYRKLVADVKNEWLIPYIEKALIKDKGKEYLDVYKQLALCLENKNYFIISLCQDGLIKLSGLDSERIVEPCGTYEKLQCSEGCHKELYEIPTEIMEQVTLLIKGDVTEDTFIQPVCPVCGKPLTFNHVETENYVEEGYLSKWQKYKLWLQGTVNKKLCVLELGVGLKYPTVIRWPFEKVVFFNQKAELFRVHSKLYQMTEEIKEKGYGICCSPLDFVKELSNKF